KDSLNVYSRSSSPSGKILWIILILLLIVSIAVSVVFVLPYVNQQPAVSAVEPVKPPSGISSLGHIEPEDGTVRLGARSLSGQPSLVATLLVEEGDAVRSGQVVATLTSNDQLEKTWQQAEARVKVAQARLEQVRAGAKTADLAAQQAEIARLQAELA